VESTLKCTHPPTAILGIGDSNHRVLIVQMTPLTCLTQVVIWADCTLVATVPDWLLTAITSDPLVQGRIFRSRGGLGLGRWSSRWGGSSSSWRLSGVYSHPGKVAQRESRRAEWATKRTRSTMVVTTLSVERNTPVSTRRFSFH